MRISEIRIDGYGIWRDLCLHNFAETVTVFSGANEAGKSTLMQFIRDALFVSPVQKDTGFIPPVDGGDAGGCILFEIGDSKWQVECQWQYENDHWNDHARWQRQSDQSWEESDAPEVTTHLDRQIFENVFCLGLSELGAVNQLDRTAASELLYSLSTGLERGTVLDAMHRLQAESDLIWSSGRGKISAIWNDWKETTEHESAKATEGAQWIETVDAQRQCDEALEKCEQTHTELASRVEFYETATKTASTWHALEKVNQQSDSLPYTSDERHRWLRRWNAIAQRQTMATTKYKKIQAKKVSVRDQIADLSLNGDLWRQRRQIEGLLDQTQRLMWLETRLGVMPAHSSDPLTSTLVHGADSTSLGLNLPQISPEMIAEIHQQASALESARAQVVELERRVNASTPIHRQPESVEDDHHEMRALLHDAAERVSLLRRRVQLKHHIDTMVRHRKELQQESELLLQRQVLSPQNLVYLGIPFVLGVTLILGGLFWSSAPVLGWPLAILGLIGWVSAVVGKVVLEKSAEREFEECHEQRAAVERQLEQTRREAAAADHRIPASAASLEERLTEAEQELESIENELPRDVVENSNQVVSQDLETACEERDRARTQWRNLLLQCGLPDNFTLDMLKQKAVNLPQERMALQADQLSAMEQHEYQMLVARIRRLADEGLEDASDQDPTSLLDQLHHALIHERRNRIRRRKLKHQLGRLKRAGSRMRLRLKKCKRRQRTVLEHLGIESRDELPRLKETWQSFQELEHDRRRLKHSLNDSLGQQQDWDQMSQWVQAHTHEELAAAHAAAAKELQALEEKKIQLHERRGRLKQQRTDLESKPAYDEARLDRACVESAFCHLATRWASLALCGNQLRRVQRQYESDRQPETLRDASRYFHFLTQEQYDRVWTPWDRDLLLVETSEGQQLSVDQLSTGTRELLFLALRLAIVAFYGKRGQPMPVILDDVLVNLDRQRCEAACRLLTAFSDEGHQVLFFTCHDHIADAFRAVDATVMALPASVRRGLSDSAVQTSVPMISTGEDGDLDSSLPLPMPAEFVSADLVVVNSDDAEVFADESANQALDVTTEMPMVDFSPVIDEEADEVSDDILWIAEDEGHEQLEDDDEYETEYEDDDDAVCEDDLEEEDDESETECEADNDEYEDEYEDDDVESGWEDEDEDYERDEAA